MTFRILSLDGGGIRGIIAARILEVIEQRLQRPLTEYFDLIAGTSTGAIAAAGLMAGRSASDLVNLYRYNGSKIFPYRSRFDLRRLPLLLKYGISAPKFCNDGLIEVLRAELGETKTLASVSPQGIQSTKLMITSYDTLRRNPVIFKSWRSAEWYASVPLWEACVCSAAAPTYFPAYRLLVNTQLQRQEYSMIDGGVGANNPTACAVAEAIRLLRLGQVKTPNGRPTLDQISDEITVLSIGTGDLGQSLPWQEVRSWGLLQWAPRIVDVVMAAPADIHRYIARQIVTKADTEDPACYLRLQPELDQKFGAIDNANPTYLNALLAETDRYLNHPQIAEKLDAFLNC